MVSTTLNLVNAIEIHIYTGVNATLDLGFLKCTFQAVTAGIKLTARVANSGLRNRV